MYAGLGLFLIVLGLILEFVPRGNHRALDWNFVAVVIMIIGALMLLGRLAMLLRRRYRYPVGVIRQRGRKDHS